MLELQTLDLDSMIVDFSKDVVMTPEILKLRRDRILQLEESFKTLPENLTMEEFNEGKIQHHFGTGVYARELFLPAGTVCVSKIHKGKTVNVIAKGTVSVIDPNNGYNTYQGPICFVSEPLTKRVVIVHEDTLWITSHINENDSQDLDEIETKTIAKNFEDKLLTKENLCLGGV